MPTRVAFRAILTVVPAHAIEFFLLFFAGPAVFAFTRHRIPAIPALWVWTGWCLFVLLHDGRFNKEHLWDAAPFPEYAPAILSLFAIALAIGVPLLLRFQPDSFLSLPRSKPKLWALLMVLYPTLSVYPQGIVFRAFVFDRYRDLFGPNWAIVLASACAFAWVHIVFRNWLAVFLTFLGGVIFGFRYLETGSLFVSSFEHALYGCAIFTIGLGPSFYHRAMQRR